MTSFNLLDIAFIGLGLIFMIIAFFRGFVKEVFALISWIIAISLSFLLAPLAAKLFGLYFSNKLIINFGSQILIFVLVFIIAGLSTSKMSAAIRKSLPSSIDQSLGVLYGLIKNLLIFGLVYSVINNVYLNMAKYGNMKSLTNKETSYLPSWLRDAKSYKIIKSCGELIDPITKNLINKTIKNVEVELNNSDSGSNNLKIDSNKIIKQNSKSESGSAESGNDSNNDNIGYSKKEIEKMDRLIDVIAK
jgi:membrane protein required for colicin V production